MPTPAPVVLRPADRPSHARAGGASTTPLVGPAIGAAGFLNGITRFPPGAAIAWHSHNCEESVLLLEGRAALDLEQGPPVELQPLDTTWIPAGLSHRFRNLSADAPMAIFWTYARTDATRTLVETGETQRITAEQQVAGDRP